MASIESLSGLATPVVNLYQQQRRRTVIDLLDSRQALGMRKQWSPRQRLSKISSADLSYATAWNASRFNNMIMLIGPGTPASLLMQRSTPSLTSPSYDNDDEDSDGGSGEGSDSQSNSSPSRSSSNQPGGGGEQADQRSEADFEEILQENSEEAPTTGAHETDGEEDEDDDDDDESDDDISNIRRLVLESRFSGHGFFEAEDNSDDENVDLHGNPRQNPRRSVPSLRHSGCINTAAWLDCGWKLSASNSTSGVDAAVTNECPTQLITSGDDHILKFWDVSHAMGMGSPLPGGTATVCPFSAPDPLFSADELCESWGQQYNGRSDSTLIPGAAIPLASIHTGHRGNVFHVTPCRGHPGKVATCGADGFLRISDLNRMESSVIVSPELDDDTDDMFPSGFLSYRSPMCFSHHFLDNHSGLLCSQRGLRRFDIRIPPGEQQSRSLLNREWSMCKACAVWPTNSTANPECGDSAYVFVGGSSPYVALCDLRMTSTGSSKVVQSYCPRGLLGAESVSVSGLDLSRDGQELLVSYESDQIYTFPVFPKTQCSTGPSIDEIEASSTDWDKFEKSSSLHELAAYGGHLNRFTFLKNAKYAGPNDEYICTGSDSGNAWVYEKSTGAVVSLVNADNSTCNGVIPHPSLPVFISYGIDSTAKLWKASLPVDSNTDDSCKGRALCARKKAYSPSPVVSDWYTVRRILNFLSRQDESPGIMFPNEVPGGNSQINKLDLFSAGGEESSSVKELGNNLHNLPSILQKNLHACIISSTSGDSEPVESSIDDLRHRISIMRNRHQADKNGFLWDSSLSSMKSSQVAAHPADCVLSEPSDWVLHSPKVSSSERSTRRYFNTKDYGDFYRFRYKQIHGAKNPIFELNSLAHDDDDIGDDSGSERHVVKCQLNVPAQQETAEPSVCEESSSASVVAAGSVPDEKPLGDSRIVSPSSKDASCSYPKGISNCVYETMAVMKQGGNEALQAGDFDKAAYRYDLAIQYAALVFMNYPSKDLAAAIGTSDEGGIFGPMADYLNWSPILRLLITVRLNMSLLMLKKRNVALAVSQTLIALKELAPFCHQRGVIVDLQDEMQEADPGIYEEAMGMKCKAMFRLGSIHFDRGNFKQAAEYFEKSLQCNKDVGKDPDELLVKRLEQARCRSKSKTERARKKFKFAFGEALKDDRKTDSS